MGAANVVPGVSGGTIALISGIYYRLIASISAFGSVSVWKLLFKGKFGQWWKQVDGSFLLALFVGLAVSTLSLAKVVTWSLVEYPVITWAFFFGLIVVSAVYMLLDIRNWKIRDAVWLVLGAGLGLSFCFLSPTSTPDTWWFYAVSGAVAICTMILPGVSGSFVLQILGNYDTVMASLDVTDPNWGVLVPFAAGAVTGILAFAKFLKWLLSRFERTVMLVLVGFVMGTVLKVWPWYDMQAVEAAGHGLQIPGAVIAAVLGGALIILLQKLSESQK